MGRLLRGNTQGFTLVELLIVVAIIGVLSTIGVPTFRKMVTKAKKSEAKVAMGGLFTVESAFYTEYSVYGDRLDKVGFEVEGRQKLYTVGFPTDANCTSGTTFNPLESGAAGPNLKNLMSDYYSAAGGLTVRARGVTAATGTTTNPLSTCYVDTSALTGANATTRTTVGVEVDGTKFTASATGNISPGVAANASLVATDANHQDVWVIDNTRLLVNAVDGTN